MTPEWLIQTEMKLQDACCGNQLTIAAVLQERSKLRELMPPARNDAVGFQVVCHTANFRWVFFFYTQARCAWWASTAATGAARRFVHRWCSAEWASALGCVILLGVSLAFQPEWLQDPRAFRDVKEVGGGADGRRVDRSFLPLATRATATKGLRCSKQRPRHHG